MNSERSSFSLRRFFIIFSNVTDWFIKRFVKKQTRMLVHDGSINDSCGKRNRKGMNFSFFMNVPSFSSQWIRRLLSTHAIPYKENKRIERKREKERERKRESEREREREKEKYFKRFQRNKEQRKKKYENKELISDTIVL